MTHPSPPPGLDQRGNDLWRDLHAERDLGAAGAVLLAEACRIADRLDHLDSILRRSSGDWLQAIGRDDDDNVVQIVIDSVLAEARQQATALKGIVSELRQHTAKTGGQGKNEKRSGGDGVDEIAARRATKEASRVANASG